MSHFVFQYVLNPLLVALADQGGIKGNRPPPALNPLSPPLCLLIFTILDSVAPPPPTIRLDPTPIGGVIRAAQTSATLHYLRCTGFYAAHYVPVLTALIELIASIVLDYVRNV